MPTKHNASPTRQEVAPEIQTVDCKTLLTLSAKVEYGSKSMTNLEAQLALAFVRYADDRLLYRGDEGSDQ